MPANTAYALDLQALSIFERPGASWDLLFSGEGMQPINQDDIAQGIMWEGELVLENPRYSARVLTDPPAYGVTIMAFRPTPQLGRATDGVVPAGAVWYAIPGKGPVGRPQLGPKEFG